MIASDSVGEKQINYSSLLQGLIKILTLILLSLLR